MLVHIRQVQLRILVALFRRPLKPLHRLDVIPLHALPFVVHHSEIVLGFGVSLFRRRTIKPQRGFIVAALKSRVGVFIGTRARELRQTEHDGDGKRCRKFTNGRPPSLLGRMQETTLD